MNVFDLSIEAYEVPGKFVRRKLVIAVTLFQAALKPVLESIHSSQGDLQLKNFFAFSKKLSSMSLAFSPMSWANSWSLAFCSALSLVGTAIWTCT